MTSGGFALAGPVPIEIRISVPWSAEKTSLGDGNPCFADRRYDFTDALIDKVSPMS